MEKIDSSTNSTNPNENDKNKFEEVLEIIKNDIVYNFKITLEKEGSSEKTKIVISFVLNDIFQIYEGNVDQAQVKENNENLQFYQDIIYQIRNENIEIIHQAQNNIEQFIILKIVFNEGSKEIKLIPAPIDDKNKLNFLTKNFISLQKKYLQLKKEMKNTQIHNHAINHPMEVEDNDSNSEDDDFNYFHYNHNIINNINNNVINNTITNYQKSDENHILLEINSQIWCMLNLNKITYTENNTSLDLNLVAIGFSNGKIIIIDINSLKIHQELKTPNTVYSLTQFINDPKYLICSLSNGLLIIFILKDTKYEQIQVLRKPPGLKHGEINKVITFSDGNLATAERGVLSIWKPKIEDGIKKFEFFKELITGNDTCQLLEVNPQIFACAIYRSKLIKVYKNEGKDYPLLGNILNVESHGNNSNAMTKVNDNIFCSGGKNGYIYIVSVFPLQVIQKIILTEGLFYISFLHNSNDGFIFTSVRRDIIQYKIIKDERNNFIKLEKFDTITDGEFNSTITTTRDGKIFYSQTNDNLIYKTKFCLKEYKK